LPIIVINNYFIESIKIIFIVSYEFTYFGENNYKGILYDFSGSNGYLYYPNNANYQGSSTERREPDVVSSYDGGSSDTVGIELSNLTSEYNAMIESVLKYKGF